jgi:hypothetical protein
MLEWWNGGLEGLGGLESLEFRGNREKGRVFILFKHSNILTFKHFLLPNPYPLTPDS